MKQGIDKLYDKTPVSALGALASGAFLRADKADIQDIYMAIGNLSPREKLNFACAAHNHSLMVLLWALDCQKTYRMVLELTVYLANSDPNDEGANIKLTNFIKEAFQRKFVALVAAMRKLCDEGGFEFEPNKQIAGIDETMERLMGNAPVIPEWVEDFVAQYGVAV